MSLSERINRRELLKYGTGAAAMGLLNVRKATAQERERLNQLPPPAPAPNLPPPAAEALPERLRGFSRHHPSYGGPPGSDTYYGKLVPGFRLPGMPPVPAHAPDLPRLAYRMVDGWKEFHLHNEHVRREFLPGRWIDMIAYNGVAPGPLIEATIGDRIRILVHNRLPEGTTMHFHGAEDDVEDDGVPGITQDFILPGDTFAYEFEIHQTGSFFYHAHVPLQEAQGSVGSIVLQPTAAFDPPVDRDFYLTAMNHLILPNNTVPVSWLPGGSWQTINGRSAPYTTPMVVKHGERVRIRIMNFSKFTPHSFHLHGHTFWITGYEGARLPKSSWQARNATAIHIAETVDIEFIANNPGDWLLHCQMEQHMQNFIPRAITPGPRLRPGQSASDWRRSIGDRPPPQISPPAARDTVPGFPQQRPAQGWTAEQTRSITDRREVRGMREGWYRDIGGLMTFVRVLPEDLYNRVMHSDEVIEPGEIFREIVARNRRRRGR